MDEQREQERCDLNEEDESDDSDTNLGTLRTHLLNVSTAFTPIHLRMIRETYLRFFVQQAKKKVASTQQTKPSQSDKTPCHGGKRHAGRVLQLSSTSNIKNKKGNEKDSMNDDNCKEGKLNSSFSMTLLR